jgi:putative nucleotidyltransferase with HDIG domain
MDSSLLADHAQYLAERLLESLPERWLHTTCVAHHAALLAARLGVHDSDLLVAAAWLHDIGYAPAVRQTGFHPLDGARLLDRLGWAPDLSCLVAHHSGARFVAEVQGLTPAMTEYPFDDSPLMDTLTYADQTIGPGGRRMTVEERMQEMLRRHGPGSPNARALPRRGPYLRAVAARVQRRLLATANQPLEVGETPPCVSYRSDTTGRCGDADRTRRPVHSSARGASGRRARPGSR